MPAASVVVRRGSQVQYTPQALRAQSGPVTRTIAQKSIPISAPATASASALGLRLAR